MYQNKFKKIFESNFQRFQGGGILAGDVVKFVDNVLSNDWFNSQADNVKEIISSMLDSDLNIRVSSVYGLRSATDGAKQQDQQVDDYYVDVAQELSPGMLSNIVSCPINLVTVVDLEGNLAPIPDSLRYDDRSHIDPQPVDLEEGGDESDGVFGTKIKEGDKQLPEEDTPGLGDAAEDHIDTSAYMR